MLQHWPLNLTSSTAEIMVMVEKIRKAAQMENRGERPLVLSPVSGLMSDMVPYDPLRSRYLVMNFMLVGVVSSGMSYY